jgi:4-amino-4-deoxy-L-arabinose transferase-like glycosyltransferase
MAANANEFPRQDTFVRSLSAHPQRNALIFIAALTLVRFVSAALMPLSFDECYFWLWSKNLAVSYYDHPPLIALATRLGTLLFGDTQFGVRFVSCMLSIAASWALWRAAAILLASESSGAFACCLFNATLMVASQSIAAIPDALVLPAAAFLLLGIAKLDASGDGRWWLAIGGALGMAFLAKYTAFFLAAAVLVWLVFAQQGRVWLKTPWPLAAFAIALVCFAPNLFWNASHDWISFKFQFGRVVVGQPTIQYLLEFVGAQFALASPFILIAAIAALFGETIKWPKTGPLAAPVAMVWPALAYFAVHAVHSRVQGNWPSFTYPALSVLAVAAMTNKPDATLLNRLRAAFRILALPTAGAFLLVVYAQAAIGFLPWGHRDPIARMTAIGIVPVADQVSAIARRDAADAVVTSNYVVTGWLSFYLEPRLPVVQVTEDYRWLSAPHADARLLRHPLLFVSQHPAAELRTVSDHFSTVKFEQSLTRSRNGIGVDKFYVFLLSGFHGAPTGRIANASAP